MWHIRRGMRRAIEDLEALGALAIALGEHLVGHHHAPLPRCGEILGHVRNVGALEHQLPAPHPLTKMMNCQL